MINIKIPEQFLGRTVSERYQEAFAAYERRCGNRAEKIYRDLVSRLGDFPEVLIDLLDIGVGNGSSAVLATQFLKHDVRITAIDIIPSFFPIAARNFISHGVTDMRFVAMNMLDSKRMNIFHEAFDLVLASNVLYRHTDNCKLICDLLNCCKQGGYLAIIHSTSNTPWTQALAKFGSWASQQHGSDRLIATLSNSNMPFEVSMASYHVDVNDVLTTDSITEEQADFLIWMLPRSMPLTTANSEHLLKTLQDLCDDRNRITDERNIILVRR